MISERTRDKIAAARRKGKWSGGMPILGYTVHETKLVVDKHEAGCVRQIFDQYLASVPAGCRQGARSPRLAEQALDHKEGPGPRRPGIRQRLAVPTADKRRLCREVRYKDEVHPGEHKAIVDAEVFERVQTLLLQNGRSGGRDVRNKHGALLRGILRCKACNCGMSHSFSSKGPRQYRYYVCQRAQMNGWEACPSPSVPAGEIERVVIDEIKEIGRDPALIKETMAHQARRQAEDQIERLRAERGGLVARLRADHAELGTVAGAARPGDPRLADLNDRIGEAERRATEVDSELAALEGALVDEAEVAAALADFDAVWECLAPREQARVVELLVERVVYDRTGGSVAIAFRESGIKTLAAELTNTKEKAA